MIFIDADELSIRKKVDKSGRKYLASLEPTDELFLEKCFKKALEKKKERRQQKCLPTSVTPAGLRAGSDLKDMKDRPFSNSDSSTISSDTVDPFYHELPFANGFPEEPASCTPSHRPLYQLQKLLHCSPIVDGILSISSASAIANIYSVARLERPDWVNRHITPLRDIFSPLELEQVHKMCRKDYSFIFLGKDLHRMEERLQDPEKYYSNANRQSKLRVWMLMVQSTFIPPRLSAQTKNPMPINFPPGEWLNTSLSRSIPDVNEPTHAMKWNTDPGIHVEWYDHVWNPFQVILFLEASTSGFMWKWNERGDVPLLDYIDVGRHPGVIREVPFKHLGEFQDPIDRYRLCRHWFLLRLGYLSEPMENWSCTIPVFPRCDNPECRDGSICFRRDQRPCSLSRSMHL